MQNFAIVWVAGFEPTTSCTPCKHATRLRYTQIQNLHRKKLNLE